MIQIGNNFQKKERIFGSFIFCFLLITILTIFSFSNPLYAVEDNSNSNTLKEEPTPSAPPQGIEIPQEPSITHHSITLDGKELKYTATVGFIPILDDKTGESRASIFFTAYTQEGDENPSQRPVTFAFNGGPGSASLWVHLGAFGPKKVILNNDGTKLPAPPYLLNDNEYTILDLTDLVFIDPVGTGFSRVEGKSEGKEFWGVQEDLNVIGEFIRLYLTRNRRWASPLYIAGESYGTIRAAGLSTTLQNLGIFPSGIILISPILDYALDSENFGNDQVFILNLPTYAASAWYHKKNAPRLQGDLEQALKEVREWSQKDFLMALWKGNTISEKERTDIINRMVEYTGLSPEFIDRHNLRIGIEEFAGEILKDQKSLVSIYDTRVSGPGEYDINNDPILAVLTSGPFISAFNDYLLSELQFVTDRKYIPSSEEAFTTWNWLNKDQGGMGYPNTANSLCNAIRRTGFLQVFVASGLYDLVTPYDNTVYLVNHFDLPPDRLKNIIFSTYDGGHMMYINSEAHRKLKEDLRNFYDAPKP